MRKAAAAEVARKHALRRNETRSIRRIRARAGSLVSGKEEKFARDDGTTDSASELIALQRIPPERICIPRVHIAVSEKFKEIAVECIRAGFNDGTDSPRRVQSVLGRERTGFHFEFL